MARDILLFVNIQLNKGYTIASTPVKYHDYDNKRYLIELKKCNFLAAEKSCLGQKIFLGLRKIFIEPRKIIHERDDNLPALLFPHSFCFSYSTYYSSKLHRRSGKTITHNIITHIYITLTVLRPKNLSA